MEKISMTGMFKITDCDGSIIILKDAVVDIKVKLTTNDVECVNGSITKKRDVKEVIVYCKGITFKQPKSFFRKKITNLCYWIISKLEIK